MEKEISILIPVYNEEKAISSTIHDIRAAFDTSGWKYEIIVVDDASKDGSAEEARKSGVKVFVHPKNMGYGGALRTGVENAAYDWVGTIDADCSYPAKEFLKLLPFVQNHDMVVGARQGKHYWGTVFKQPARLVFLALAQFVVGKKIPDVNSGLRIMKKSIVEEMLPRLCRGFSFSTTLTLSFLSSYRFVHFEPIEYLSRMGSSKVRYVRDTLRTTQLMMETIVYYNPIKAAVILMIFPLVVGFLSLIFAMIKSSAFLLLISINMFCWALLFLGLGFVMFMMLHSKESGEHGG